MSMDGLETMISYFNADNFSWVTGIILLANKKATPHTKMVKTSSGRINLMSEIPAALIATSSNFSPRFPKVMMDENNKASGKAMGTQNKATSPINLSTVIKSSPFPTKSSIYNQKNCMVSTKREMANAAINGPIKERIISMSSFFITIAVLILLYELRKSNTFTKGTGIG